MFFFVRIALAIKRPALKRKRKSKTLKVQKWSEVLKCRSNLTYLEMSKDATTVLQFEKIGVYKNLKTLSPSS